jgi:hypothetical protein
MATLHILEECRRCERLENGEESEFGQSERSLSLVRLRVTVDEVGQGQEFRL